ncbi:PRC-barrel domain-containing protein [Devosia sp. YIM 151766]|uniref:PRC-barrel domain-containing protein n=1 Tax=Devosia sp. YIM 151766 TaxID=3017325 RepID=UPI00255CEEC8|nr:PRC-barrel domain-containing protein [Devosia sp. YIM 151766]WIY54492.1 PRC-barrel domain-containing protein [Devosia sp. YIM 151766]
MPGRHAPHPDHASHPRLEDYELTQATLEGAPVYGPGNEELGKVTHVLGTGVAGEVIIDVGGFLGLGAKPVAVPIGQLDFMRDENRNVHALTYLSKEELKALPAHRSH